MCKFLMQFLRHPRSVGAIAPSGKNLSEKMVEPINFQTAKIIVEYGAGTGSFTRELLKRKREDTLLISIEKNDKFVKILKKEFPEDGEKNFRIVHGGAEDACEILALHGYEQADYVVSGLPFTSLPKNLSVKIFGETQKAITRKEKLAARLTNLAFGQAVAGYCPRSRQRQRKRYRRGRPGNGIRLREQRNSRAYAAAYFSRACVGAKTFRGAKKGYYRIFAPRRKNAGIGKV